MEPTNRSHPISSGTSAGFFAVSAGPYRQKFPCRCRHQNEPDRFFVPAQKKLGRIVPLSSKKLQVSFSKEPYKRDYILQKRPMIFGAYQSLGRIVPHWLFYKGFRSTLNNDMCISWMPYVCDFVYTMCVMCIPISNGYFIAHIMYTLVCV